jgi:hypothetical protein
MVASEDRGRFEGLRKPAANIGGAADDWEQFLLGISTWESALVAFEAVGGMFFGRILVSIEIMSGSPLQLRCWCCEYCERLWLILEFRCSFHVERK